MADRQCVTVTPADDLTACGIASCAHPARWLVGAVGPGAGRWGPAVESWCSRHVMGALVVVLASLEESAE